MPYLPHRFIAFKEHVNIRDNWELIQTFDMAVQRPKLNNGAEGGYVS